MRLYRRKKGGPWWVDIREGGRRERYSLKTSDRRVAESRAAQHLSSLQREQIAEALGLETHRATRATELADLLEEWARELDRRGRTPRWRALSVRRCGALLAAMGAAKLADVTPERIAAALSSLTAPPPPKSKKAPRKASAATQNYHRQALSALFRWLVRQGRWDRDPCAAVGRSRVVADKQRRPLRPEELERLLETAPPHRRLIYLVAATTGLRRAELNTLRWIDVGFEDATVRVRPRNEKAKRGAVLPLADVTVAAWRAYQRDPWSLAGEKRLRGRERLLWAERLEQGLALPPLPRAETLRSDLRRAGVTWSKDADRVDLHALRSTFITSLQRAGVGLAQAQQLARHSDPRLTANIYTRLDQADGRAAVAALGSLFGGVPSRAPGCAPISGGEAQNNDLRLNARPEHEADDSGHKTA